MPYGHKPISFGRDLMPGDRPTEDQIKEVKQDWDDGLSQKEIAKSRKLPLMRVKMILGKKWEPQRALRVLLGG